MFFASSSLFIYFLVFAERALFSYCKTCFILGGAKIASSSVLDLAKVFDLEKKSPKWCTMVLESAFCGDVLSGCLLLFQTTDGVRINGITALFYEVLGVSSLRAWKD